MSKFICDKCGLCCRNLNRSEIYKNLHNGDGVCKYLVDNKCSIYGKRPLLCRVEECYYKFFKDRMTLEEYYELNYKACDELKKINEKEK